MKKILLWFILKSLLISVIISLLISVVMFYAQWDQNADFLQTAVNFFIMLPLIWVTLFLFMLVVFLKPVLKIRKIISENPFSELVPERYDSGNPFAAIKKVIQRNNQRSLEELEKLNTLEKYRREYIGNVSHELKTPIFNIQGYVSSLLEGALEDPAVNRHFLEKADKNIDRMINIVMDLQTISRFEAGELELNREVFELNSLIEDVVETEKEHAAKSLVAFQFFKNREVWVDADKFRIRQVLTNLLVNSIRYCKQGGGITTIRLHDLPESVRVEISDNGIGIEEKHLSRIFERFYRVDSSRSREKGGSGLGLAIVKHIIEAHGESIEVLSTPGVGTVFTFSLKKPQGRVKD